MRVEFVQAGVRPRGWRAIWAGLGVLRAGLWLRAGRPERALRAVLGTQATYLAYGLLIAGHALESLGRDEEAMSAYELALEREPGNGEVRLDAIEHLLGLGYDADRLDRLCRRVDARSAG